MRRERLFSIFVKRALRGEPLVIGGQGSRRQNFVDARDVARLTVRAIETDRLAPVYNTAAGETISTRELAEACVRELDSASEIQISGGDEPSDAEDWQVDIALAREELDWTPRIDIGQSIRDFATTLRCE